VQRQFYIKEPAKKVKLCDPKAVGEHFKSLKNADQESFWIISLNSKNAVLATDMISLGGVNHSVVDMKILFRRVLQAGATAFLTLHNHPSESTSFSSADIQVTGKIAQFAQMIDLCFHDHLLVAGNDIISAKEQGILK